MTTRNSLSLVLVGIAASMSAIPATAQTNDDSLTVDLEVYGGRSVVPPDIIENDIDQVRIEEVLGSEGTVTYREGDTRVFVGAGAQVFAADSQLNRYGLALGGSQDVPIANNGRIRLRLGGTYDHVLGDEGRVFNRLRGDAQLIGRHGGGHTSVARARYGYRNQSERRFTGFDQNEWLGELRHTYRPQGSESSVSAAAFLLDVDAEDDRFSFRGLGLRVLGRTPLGADFSGFARASYLSRDFEDPFSAAFPFGRNDDVWRISGGVERPIAGALVGFAELGYIDHASNVPTRDFSGVVGRVGLRVQLD